MNSIRHVAAATRGTRYRRACRIRVARVPRHQRMGHAWVRTRADVVRTTAWVSLARGGRIAGARCAASVRTDTGWP